MKNDNQLPQNKCYICRNENIVLYSKVETYDILKCLKCGMIWVGNEISQEEIKAFYDNNYFSSDKITGYKDYLGDEHNHRKNAEYILKKVNKNHNLNDKKILDIGCAFGFLLDEAQKQFNSDCYGFEISDEAYQFAKETLHLKVFNNDITKGLFDDETFDVMFMIGTIEHLLSPRETINKYKNLLKKNGLLVITTLNINGILPFYALKPPEHIFYFNKKNITTLLNELGFAKIYHTPYFVNYKIYEVFNIIKRVLPFNFFNLLSAVARKIFKNISLKIPTNEMLIIFKKQ